MKNNIFMDSIILIVEDDLGAYLLLSEMVFSCRAMHIWAKNGKEALEVLDMNPNISAILMDINMPVMDGITATRRIREKGINTPIIFQSSYSSDEKIDECLDAGGNDFLSKPINYKKLCSIIEKYTLKINSTT